MVSFEIDGRMRGEYFDESSFFKFVVCNLNIGYRYHLGAWFMAARAAQKIMMMDTIRPYRPIASAKMRMRIIPTKIASVCA